MAEVSSLVLNVKSDTVRKGSDRLDRLARSATTAGVAEKQMAVATTASAGASTKAATARTAQAKATGMATGATAANTMAQARNAKSQFIATGATNKLATAQVGATAATRALTGATATLGATVGTMVAPLLAILAPLVALKELFSSTIELQNWEAQLKTATGSAENAAVAFDALENFAGSTPYQLQQSIKAFTQLVNLGLTPSEKALRSYGNTASAMGKDLTQLVEAVADATVGEFERLKEFGIKAKSEGDNVSFTFRGMTTTIGKNAEEIEKYLIRLGEVEFAGAMEDRMATVGGLVSNFGDQWDKLFRTLSEMGIGSLIGESVQLGIDSIESMIAVLESGQFETSLDSWTTAFDEYSDDFIQSLDIINGLLNDAHGRWAADGVSVWQTIGDSVKLFPAVVRATMQATGSILYTLGDYAATAGKFMWEQMTIWFHALLDSAKLTGSAIYKALNPFDDTDAKTALIQGMAEVVATTVAASAKLENSHTVAIKKITAATEGYRASLVEIESGYDAVADRVVGLGAQSDWLREKYDKEKAARDAARGSVEFGPQPLSNSDRLARFRITPSAPEQMPLLPSAAPGAVSNFGPQLATGGELLQTSQAASQMPLIPLDRDFERLVEHLARQEEVIETSYIKRLELIRTNTREGSLERAEMTARVTEIYHQEVEAFAEKTVGELDIARNGWATQLEELKLYYDHRRELILSNESLTEEERTELLVDLAKQRNDLLNQIDSERTKQGLDLASEYFGNFTGLARSNNKELAGIGKAALVAQKAIAITQATIKTYEGATSAYAAMAGIPVVGPALGAAAAATVIAAGVANVASIATAGTNVGSFAAGGIIPGSSHTGDSLTASVNSGEMILNGTQQARLFNAISGGGNAGGGRSSVTIVNQTRTPVEAEARTDANGNHEIIIREAVQRTKSDLVQEAQLGGGEFVPTLAQNFGLARTGS